MSLIIQNNQEGTRVVSETNTYKPKLKIDFLACQFQAKKKLQPFPGTNSPVALALLHHNLSKTNKIKDKEKKKSRITQFVKLAELLSKKVQESFKLTC